MIEKGIDFVIIVLLIICMLNCNYSDCKVEDEAYNEFMFQLNTIDHFVMQNPKKEFYCCTHEYIYDSYHIIQMVTDIDGQANFGEVFTYNLDNYREDKNNWKNWLKDNECDISTELLDSVKRTVNLARNGYYLDNNGKINSISN